MKLRCIRLVSFVVGVMFLFLVGGSRVEKKAGTSDGIVVPPWKKPALRRGDIDLSKPGTCPPERIVSRLSPDCALDCIFDLECPGTERCCPDHCGGAACTETTDNANEFTTTSQVSEPVTTPAADTGANTEATQPQATVSTAKTTETTTYAKTDRNSGIYLGGDALVNVSAVVGDDLVLRCNISASADEPLLLFWMVQIGVRFIPWSDVPPSNNKRVSHDSSRLEINGVTLDDSQKFVCFRGHSTGYLTQTFLITVTEETGEANTDVPSDPCQRYPNVCQNGATCVTSTADTGGFSCACTAGWEGSYCAENGTLACDSSPCRNGGICEDLDGAYQCICLDDFTGPLCKVEIVAPSATTEAPVNREETMSDACYMPLNEGSCSRKETQWYYDTETQLCQQFTYSGCRGNANRFSSYEDCQWECPELPRDPCTHPILTGRCKAMIPRWGYSARSKTCVEFVYGGCAPTGNNFLSEDECARTCMSDTPPCQRCGIQSLPRAYCNSDFVITGIVRRLLFADDRLKTVVLELTRRYKGHGLAFRRSRFVDEPLVVAKSRSEDSNRCLGRCFEDLQDGKEYILTGTLSRDDAGKTVAFFTSSSYVKSAGGRRLDKLELVVNDRVFNRRCSRRTENPL